MESWKEGNVVLQCYQKKQDRPNIWLQKAPQGQGRGQRLSRPRPRPGHLEAKARTLRDQNQGHRILYSRTRTVLEDPIPVKNRRLHRDRH